MRCEPYREALSARLDGEDPGVAPADLDRHLSSCEACQAFAARSQALHRRVAVRPADPVPDLTGPILAAVTRHLPPVAEHRRSRVGGGARGGAGGAVRWSRWALLAVALIQLAIAVPPVLFGHDAGAPVHLAREIGAWDVALAFALLLVVLRPRRAQGLVPFAGCLAVAMVAAAVIDAATGRVAPLAESPHLLELAGLALLWVMARQPVDDSPLVPGLGRHRPTLAA